MKGIGVWLSSALVVLVVIAIAMRIDFLRAIILPQAAVQASTAGK
jgi:hypothetical protein